MKFVLILSAFFWAIACKNDKDNPQSSGQKKPQSEDPIQKAISINDLASQLKNLHRKQVVTEGVFSWAFEDNSVCSPDTSEYRCLWIGDIGKLNLSEQELTKMTGKIVIIRGTITSGRGHMGAYLATLSDVDYLKIKD